MSNMSYCRFQNTLSSLRDCVEFLNDYSDVEELASVLSADEFKFMQRLITLCKQIAEEH